MLNNWFNNTNNPDNGLKQSTAETRVHASTIDVSHPSADLVEEKLAQRAATTALSTPHDAVLAELYGLRPEGSGDMNATDNAATDAFSAHDPLNNPYPANPPLVPGLSPPSEPLFDPFTGAHIGDLVPGEEQQTSDVKQDEELWTQLSQILRLQSDVADMHVKMEGIGLKKPGPTPGKMGGDGTNRQPATTSARQWGERAEQGVDEGAYDEADEAAENKRKLEEEFSKLNDNFTGRKDAIDKIMKNLDELSSALTTFHTLRTPMVNFPNSSRSTSANTSTSGPSRSTLQPTVTSWPPSTSTSLPVTMPMSGTQKRRLLTRVLPLLDEMNPVVDSPDSMRGGDLPNERAS